MARVSVIIPNYNYGRFLRRRIESVLGQTWTDFEVIVLDDASQDNSREIIAQFLPDPRIRIVENKINSGSTFAQWNRGACLCRGEYVWIAEADDYADPEFLATLVATLDRHPEVGLAYCQSWNIDESGKVLGSNEAYTRGLDPLRWRHDYICNGQVECRDALIFMNTIPNASAVVFRRSLYEAVGGADMSLRLSGDWMLWVRMALASGVAFHAVPLNYYRSHSSSVRSQTLNDGLWIEEMARIIAEVYGTIDLSPEALSRLREHFWKIWSGEHISRKIPLRRHLAIYRHARVFYPSIGRRVLRGLWKRGIRTILGDGHALTARQRTTLPSSNESS